MQYISQLVADGEMDCEFIVAEASIHNLKS